MVVLSFLSANNFALPYISFSADEKRKSDLSRSTNMSKRQCLIRLIHNNDQINSNDNNDIQEERNLVRPSVP